MLPHRSLPTTSLTTDLLGEPRHYSSCPAHPSHRHRALALNPTAREPSASHGHPRHRADFSPDDRGPLCPCAHRARAPWATATAGPGRPMGHHAVAPRRHSRPPAHATPQHCGLGLEPRPSAMFCFFCSFRFSKIPKKMSRKYENHRK
jgi:hypothetical protein